MARIYLQQMVENLPSGSLPASWLDLDLTTFSRTKRLFDYQQMALQNALLALWKFHSDPDLDTAGRKESFLRWYRDFGLDADLNLPLDRSSSSKRRLANLLETYYTSENNRLPFAQFVNRMSFWMATGSGKTLVIVKLIEALRTLMERGEIPTRDVLVLAHRDDLLDQLRAHVDEFNTAGELHMRLHELRTYPEVKRSSLSLFHRQELDVFYYRSDILSDEQKEKIVDFRSYDNAGQWYILLDEAHKGDKEDSKRQYIYNILSRDGFLFNFSATFTDPRDIVTTVANFNLSEFIRKGHGKHIAILKSETRAFRKGDDYTDLDKQKIVVKALLMLTCVRQYEGRVRAVDPNLYHRPLLMALVNSVNTEDADLKLLFRELARVGKGELDPAVWSAAVTELRDELRARPEYLYEAGLSVKVDEMVLTGLSQADLLRAVFNAPGPGEIEVLVRPSNRQEVACKLKTSKDPFALVRIGDISDWLKDELAGYEISHHFADEGFFERLNAPDSDINLLLGSRSFYEGWDSNRPNVIVYINIGVGTDAKKFILQSAGRGVRIEPFKDRRRRLRELAAAGGLSQAEHATFDAVKDDVLPLESAYIFGTNRTALELVIGELDQAGETAGEVEISLQIDDEAVKGKQLLVPVYKVDASPLYESRPLAKFAVTGDSLDLMQRYFAYVNDDRVMLALNESFTPRQVGALRARLENPGEHFRLDGRAYKNLESLARQALLYFSVYGKDFDQFKILEDEINHYRHIRVSLKDVRDLERRIQRVAESPKAIRESAEKLQAGEMTIEEFRYQVAGYTQAERFTTADSELQIKQIAHHYYMPVLLSMDEKIDFIRGVIRVKSEVQFLSDLEAYISKAGNLFGQFDWWLFSRVDESFDNITIPYYFSVENRIANFKPDFIFWMQRGNRYQIVFVDPKGTGRTEYEHKLDGYRVLFEDNEAPKLFDTGELKVSVHTFLYTADRQFLAEGYRRHWVDRIEQIPGQLLD